MRKKEALVLFGMGAVGYCGLELIVRKRTHWSMGVAGGACLVAVYAWEKRLRRRSFMLKCAIGASTITLIELLVGLAVNRLLGWAVWDYTKNRGNLWGQICPRFSFLWFGLCAALFPLCGLLRRAFTGAHDGNTV